MLDDRSAVTRIANDFGPDRPAFSPSQLESLAFCPFQFFQRYVLHLEPTEDRDELDDDYAARGSLIHSALENLYLAIHAGEIVIDGAAVQAEAILGPLLAQITQLIDGLPNPATRVEAGLRRIETERVRRVAIRYARQHESYVTSRYGPGAVPHLVEADFGKGGENGLPALTIGEAPDLVRIQGLIDRVDVIERPDGLFFRVIDYKTGHAPSSSDLKAGTALQLPLYALAVEQILLAGIGGRPLDAGYWALRKDGYKPLATMATLTDGMVQPAESWDAVRTGIEQFVQSIVAHLRAGRFPVAPRVADCTRTCDYRVVCRIRQIRQSGKVWADAPRLELEP